MQSILRFCCIASLLLVSVAAGAQDKIFLVDGTTVQAKVKEVGQRNIVYTRWDNQEGAEYVVARRDVEKIVFQNGTEETFARSRDPRFRRPGREPKAESATSSAPAVGERERMSLPGYGHNILALAPIQMTNESTAGVGIQYERILDKGGIISLYLPVAFSFYEDEVSNPISSSAPPAKKSRIFTYLYPGAKIYPAGSAHRVSYSVGPTFALGFGDKYKENLTLDPVSGSVIRKYEEASVFKAGFLVNNGLNIQPTKALYVGLELGIGIYYYNNETTDFAAGDEPMVQFNFKMGYRF